MNKSFKVLWNQVRGGYVVTSEAKAIHGKPGRACKSIVATAVAGVMALLSGSAVALDINNNSFGSGDGQYDSTKFISGQGQELNIQTNGDARNFIEAVMSKDFDAIRNALGTGKGVTLVGLAGGQNYIDSMSALMVQTAAFVSPQNELIKKIASLIDDNGAHFKSQVVDNLVGSTQIFVGSEDSNPLLVATVVGDRFINMLSNPTNSEGSEVIPTITRQGDTIFTAQSGNLLGLVGASSVINVDAIKFSFDGMEVGTAANKTAVVVQGNSSITLEGATSSAGVFGSGSAIALGGEASSLLDGNTTITVDTQTSAQGYEGLTVGLFGGGLAASVVGGSSNAEVTGQTTINLNSGVSGVIVGGGLAASTGDISEVVGQLLAGTGYQENISFKDDSKLLGGQSSVTSQDIFINIGQDASVAAVAGGGIALAHEVQNATQASTAEAKVGNVTITVGSVDADPVFATVEEKGEYFNAVKNSLSGLVNDFGFDSLGAVIGAVSGTPGVTVGLLGGGIAASYGQNSTETVTTPVATSTVDSATINVLSGYNVGFMGGGMALGSANQSGEGETLVQTAAQSTVGTVTMNFAGGETIGAIGGGLALFTGTGEQNDGYGAVSNVSTANINVTGGTVDGIIGGGVAIDDTNPLNNGNPYTADNAQANVETVNIMLAGGKVDYLHFSAFAGHQNQWPNNPNAQRPELRDYVDALAYAMEGQKAAVIGGGVASGLTKLDGQGLAHVNNVNIVVSGEAEVLGNIFGGGLASHGAKTTVDNVYIQVGGNDSAGPTIKGDIYAGGIAQDVDYSDQTSYDKSVSTVEQAEIVLASGTVEGNIYAGGKAAGVGDADAQSEATVESALVTLLDADVFKGSLIDGTNTTTSSVTFVNDLYELDGVQIQGFDLVRVAGQGVSAEQYSFGDKEKTVFIGADANFETLGDAAGKTVQVGNEQAAGSVGFASASDSSNLSYIVESGLLALNATAQEGKDAMLSLPSQKSAVAFVTGALDFTDSTLAIGTSGQTAGVFIGTDGVLIADASAASQTTITGSITTEGDSAVHFVNVAQEGAKATIDVAEEVVTVDNVLYKATKDEAHTFTFAQRQADELGEVGLDDFDDTDFLAQLNPNDKGARFIERFLDQGVSTVNNSNRSQQLNAAVNLATAAGVQTMAIDSVGMGIDAAARRAFIGNEFTDGTTLYAEVSGKELRMGGSESFGEIKADLGGVIVGGEYTMGDWTFGALANLGTGTARGQGDNSGVRNEVDYYGAQAYATKRFGSFGVTGMLGYTTTSNDVSHSTVALNKADVDADVISLGVRGEARFDVTQNAYVVPYVGLNYMRVSTDGYDTTQGVTVDEIDQDLYTMPVGVKFVGNFASQSGWSFNPCVDVAYVAAFGDTDVEATTQVGQVFGHTTMDVWTENVGRATLGIEARKGQLGVGVHAGYAFGDEDTQELFGQVRVGYHF